MRIGHVARAVGTTPRTIRYYEEIGLLEASGPPRPSGAHREYTEADVERLREILRFKDLLGVSLEELRELMAAENIRLRKIVRSSIGERWLASISTNSGSSTAPTAIPASVCESLQPFRPARESP